MELVVEKKFGSCQGEGSKGSEWGSKEVGKTLEGEK